MMGILQGRDVDSPAFGEPRRRDLEKLRFNAASWGDAAAATGFACTERDRIFRVDQLAQ